MRGGVERVGQWGVGVLLVRGSKIHQPRYVVSSSSSS